MTERNERNWEFSSCLNFHEFRWWIDDKTYRSLEKHFLEILNRKNKKQNEKGKQKLTSQFELFTFSPEEKKKKCDVEGGKKSRAGIIFVDFKLKVPEE